MDPGRAPSAATQTHHPSRPSVRRRRSHRRRPARPRGGDASRAARRDARARFARRFRVRGAPRRRRRARSGRRAIPRGGHRRRRGCLRRRHRHATARVPPEDRAAALANRAACRLSRSDHGAARGDCDDGLDALLRDAGADAARARDAARRSTSQTSLPDASWALLGKLLHRRGAAAARFRAYDDAAEDYDAAAACATTGPAADALRRDAETVRALARASEEENATMSVSSPTIGRGARRFRESSGGSVESWNEGGAVAARWTTTRRGGRGRARGSNR